ncbi:MAG: FG-GAP repeat domain-containing protein [Phycisphaerae bacterium]
MDGNEGRITGQGTRPAYLNEHDARKDYFMNQRKYERKDSMKLMALVLCASVNVALADLSVPVNFSGTAAQTDVETLSAHSAVSNMYVSVNFQRLTTDLSRAGDLLIGIEGPNGNTVEFGGDNNSFGFPDGGDFPAAWNDEDAGLYELGPIDLSSFNVAGPGVYTIRITNGWALSNGAEWNGSITFDDLEPIDRDEKIEHPLYVVGPAETTQEFTFPGQGLLESITLDLTFNGLGSGTFAGDLLIGIVSPNGSAIEYGGHPSFTFGYDDGGDLPGSWDEDGGQYNSGPINMLPFGLAGTGTYTVKFANGWASSSNASWIGEFKLEGIDERDTDFDFIADYRDNCPNHSNINQEDCDGDGVGDKCTISECNGSPLCSDCNNNGIPDGCGDGFPAVTNEVTGPVPITANVNNMQFATTDIDNDGDLDFVGAASGANDVVWFVNDGDLTSNMTKITIDPSFTNAWEIAVGDVNQDGRIDVAACGSTSGPLAWWSNDDGGNTWTRHDIGTLGQGRSCHLDDIDGDGYLDFIVASESNGFRWYRNVDGTGTVWDENIVQSFNLGGRGWVDTGDVDGDGDTDILALVTNENDVIIYVNNNGIGTSWTSLGIAGGFGDCEQGLFIDMDKDGDLDIVAAARTANDLAWWENINSDASSWTKRTIESNLSGARHLDAADMDNDGDIDVVACSLFSEDVGLWENLDGNGTSWERHIYPGNATTPSTAIAADIDQDGDMDTFAINGVSSARIRIYENKGGQVLLDADSVLTGDWEPGELNAPIILGLVHQGKTGDDDVALQNVTILMEEAPGTPMSNTLADAAIESFSVYHAGVLAPFSPDQNTLLATVEPDLNNGIQTIAIPTGLAVNQVSVEDDYVFYFIAMKLKDEVPGGLGTLTMTFLGEQSAAIEVQNECTLHQAEPEVVSTDINFCFNTGTCALAPAALPIGPRYLTTTPASGAIDVALRITSDDAGCLDKYVDFDASPDLADQGIAMLVDTPVYRQPADWGTLYVRGAEIVPGYNYTVSAEVEGQDSYIAMFCDWFFQTTKLIGLYRQALRCRVIV